MKMFFRSTVSFARVYSTTDAPNEPQAQRRRGNKIRLHVSALNPKVCSANVDKISGRSQVIMCSCPSAA